MRTLLIGAKGMLGTDMVQDWASEDLVPADSEEADIRSLDQVRHLVSQVRPDWIVLAAAYTDVDGSEKNSEQAFAVNSTGAENVARVASELGPRLFYISTDYVFDGAASRPYEINDPLGPLNVYGASKAAGETAVQRYAKDWCIGRTSWLFGANGLSFPEKILRAAETRPELTVVSDQVGSPTFTRDLSSAIQKLLHANARGIFHITNSGVCSWFDFAQEVLAKAARFNVQVRPITASEIARPAKRPAYSVLSPASLDRQGITMRNWKDAVPVYLEDLRRVGKLSYGARRKNLV
jgi:dTDP-4-dehydrorhamnose reductase